VISAVRRIILKGNILPRFDSREKARSGWQNLVSDNTAAIRGLRNYKKQK